MIVILASRRPARPGMIDGYCGVVRELTNWAGNVTFGARRLHRPATLDELRRIVAGTDRVRALGTGHSFSPIADSPGDLVSVAGLPATVEIDRERFTVTVAAGMRYGELAPTLDAAGFALHNLGSLPHISVAGACVTGTHGSGDRNGSLATAVSAVRMVGADGDLIALRRGEDRFAGAVVALGTLGIVTHISLDIVPAFQVRQHVYDGMPTTLLGEHFAEVFAAGYSVSAFTDWRTDRFRQVWVKQRADHQAPPAEWFGATLADGPRHPVPGMPVVNCTEQQGKPGPWHQRLPHFRLEFMPSSGDELQSEYLVPRDHAVDALTALDGIRHRIAPVLQICEVRTIAADDLWLSPASGRETVGFHFTWIGDPPAVAPVLAAIEDRIMPFGARPHWGKLFGVDPATVAARYPKLPDFRRLRQDLDPAGKFGNPLVDSYLG